MIPQTAADQRRDRLLQDLKELETPAGISEEQSKEAWSGAFMPYGIDGTEMAEFTSDQNNQLYWDDEHDSMRRKVRALYFSVADPELRRKLIKKVRETEGDTRRRLREWADDASRNVSEATRKTDNLPRTMAGIAAVGVVLSGYWVANIVGAIAGAVFSLFAGIGAVLNIRRDRLSELQLAKDGLASATDSISEKTLQPAFFSAEEELSGVEHKTFSMASAFANRVDKFRGS